MQSDTIAISIATVFLKKKKTIIMAILGKKVLHWHLNKVIPTSKVIPAKFGFKWGNYKSRNGRGAIHLHSLSLGCYG